VLRADITERNMRMRGLRNGTRNGIVSPDGRWLAYEANDSGSFEIHVTPFPGVARGRSQVSTSGGMQPL
jgi:hypothetical protein